MSGSTDCSPDAAKRALLSRTSTFVSKPVPVPGGAVDLATLDPAALINSVAHETRFVVESAAEFNARWRAALRENFEARGVVDELDTWLATGLSNGRPLKLEVMALKPDVWFSVERISVAARLPTQAWFRVHAHPNMEFEQTLVGALFAAASFQTRRGNAIDATLTAQVLPDNLRDHEGPGFLRGRRAYVRASRYRGVVCDRRAHVAGDLGRTRVDRARAEPHGAKAHRRAAGAAPGLVLVMLYSCLTQLSP